GRRRRSAAGRDLALGGRADRASRRLSGRRPRRGDGVGCLALVVAERRTYRESLMKFGVGLPTCTAGMMYPVPFADTQDIVRIAVEAEQLGYYEVAGNDHFTTQR